MKKYYKILKNNIIIGKEIIDCSINNKTQGVSFYSYRPYKEYGDKYQCLISIEEGSGKLKHFQCTTIQDKFKTEFVMELHNRKMKLLCDYKHSFITDEFYLPDDEIFLLKDISFIAPLQIIVNRFLNQNESCLKIYTIEPKIDQSPEMLYVSYVDNSKTLIGLKGSVNAVVELDKDFTTIKKITSKDNNTTVISSEEDFELETESYSLNDDRYDVEEVLFKSYDGTMLSGVLVYPKGSSVTNALLCISGTGPNDWRSLGLFSGCKDYLAKNGIAVLSYDKRGINKSGGSFESLTVEKNCRDASSAINFLRAKTGLSHVNVLAHSEGAYLSPKITGMNKYVKSLILLAPFAERYFSFLKSKYENRAKILNWPESLKLKKIKHIEHREKLIQQGKEYHCFLVHSRAGSSSLFEETSRAENHKLSLKYEKELENYSMLDHIKDLQIPIYLIHGKNDLTVPYKQSIIIYNRLKDSLNTNIRLDLLDNINHSFGQLITEEESKPFRSYYCIEKRLLELILNWLKGL